MGVHTSVGKGMPGLKKGKAEPEVAMAKWVFTHVWGRGCQG